MYAPLIIGDKLLDIEGTNLLIFSNEKFSIEKEIPLLNKEDQYCARLRKLNENFAVVFGMTSFHVINVKESKVICSHNLESIIEYIETHQNYIAIITSDLEE